MTRQREDAVLREIIRGELVGVSTSFPATILALDLPGRTCTVQPGFCVRFSDGELVDPPPIDGVPIASPGGATGGFVEAPEVGDTVLVVCAQRDLHAWLDSGGCVDPAAGAQDPLDPAAAGVLDANNAIAIPGLYTTDGAPEIPAGVTHMGAWDGSSCVQVDRDGGVRLSRSDASDPVVVSSKNAAELAAIAGHLNTLITWAGLVSAPLGIPYPPPAGAPVYTPGDTGSSKIKGVP